MVKNRVVEPNVENSVSKDKVSEEKEIPDEVLSCSFLHAVKEKINKTPKSNSILYAINFSKIIANLFIRIKDKQFTK